ADRQVVALDVARANVEGVYLATYYLTLCPDHFRRPVAAGLIDVPEILYQDTVCAIAGERQVNRFGISGEPVRRNLRQERDRAHASIGRDRQVDAARQINHESASVVGRALPECERRHQ